MSEKTKETTTVQIEVPSAYYGHWEAPTKDPKEAVRLAWERFAPDGYGEKHTLLDELEWEDFIEPNWGAVPYIYSLEGELSNFGMGPELQHRQKTIDFLAEYDGGDMNFEDPDNIKRAVELLRGVIRGVC